jgi:hypothetical protein
MAVVGHANRRAGARLVESGTRGRVAPAVPQPLSDVKFTRLGGQVDYAAIADTCDFNSNSIGLT